MLRGLRRPLLCGAVAAVVLAAAACNKTKNSTPVIAGPGPGGPGASSPIREIMVKLTKGPQSLTPMIGEELKADPPPWDTIQPQAKEFAELAAKMGQYDPPKGDKDSWAKLTSEYTASATALDQAAQAKDKDAALTAHDALTHSCMACHREHRMMRGPGGRGKGQSGEPPA